MYPAVMMMEKDTKIVLNRQVGLDTFLIGLQSAEMAGKARPGQFVMLRVGSGMDPLLRRPFSIFGTEGDTFQILYRVVGRATAILAETGKGKVVSVLGPLGRGFEMPREEQTPLLVGGGMGVAPLFFLARILDKGEFMMGFGTAEEIAGKAQPRDLRMAVSIATDDGTEGQQGFVTDLLEASLRHHLRGNRAPWIVACGPAAMLKKVAATARHHKVPCQVSLEAVMACGLGACQGCAVPASPHEKKAYFHVCHDGPAFPAGRIDWERL